MCLDSISVDSKAIVTLSLAQLPQNPGRFVLALGGLDNKIKLYCGESTGKVLLPALTFCAKTFSDSFFSFVKVFLFAYLFFSLLLFVSLKATQTGFGVWTSHYQQKKPPTVSCL